jgi:hypothetical protein
MIRVFGFLAFLALASCPGCPPPAPPVTPDAKDAATPGTCGGVCANGRRLGCAFAQNTPQGASCEDVCNNLERSGVTSWDLSCRSVARSCAEVDQCQ